MNNRQVHYTPNRFNQERDSGVLVLACFIGRKSPRQNKTAWRGKLNDLSDQSTRCSLSRLRCSHLDPGCQSDTFSRFQYLAVTFGSISAFHSVSGVVEMYVSYTNCTLSIVTPNVSGLYKVLQVCIACNQSFLFSICLKLQDIIRMHSCSNSQPIRSRFYV